MFNNFKIILLEERIVLDAALAAVIYVDVNANGSHNGTSWGNAYTNLQDALVTASSTAGADQIWIADGTYKPGATNSSTFNLPTDVQLYGGFKGNESSLSQRSPILNRTILSGDLNGNDVQGNATSKLDNSYHVVTSVGTTATLDGISIVNGNAVGPGHPNDQGGGVYITGGGNLTLNNMLLQYNSADYNGGAIHVEFFSSLTLTNSLLTKNSQTSSLIDAQHGGGALSVYVGATANISNSVFLSNSAGEDGGAIRLQSANANISNTLFLDNHAVASAGAIASLDLFSTGLPSTINIDNAIFLNNRGGSFGGAIFFVDIVGDPNSLAHISDSQFIGNGGVVFGGAVYAGDRSVLIENTNFIDNSSHTAGGALSMSSNFDVFYGVPWRSTITVKDSNFINNTVIGDRPNGFDGLVIFLPGTTFVSAVQGGGAIYQNTQSTLNIDNSNFTNNRVLQDGDGGAILVGGLKILNPDNSVFAPGQTTSISNSSFVNNRALDGNGGAIAAESVIPYTTPGVGTLTLTGSVFKNNDASSKGGALYLTDYSTTITGNTFYKTNDADVGDQVYARDTKLNGVDSGATGAKNALKNVNIFKQLDSDDLYLI